MSALSRLLRFSLPALFVAGVALSATPEPPRRPSKSPNPTPPPVQQPAPQNPSPQTSAPAPPAGRQPVDVDPNNLPPYNLPPSSRQRMRLCGERWRDLKMAGKSAGQTWRSFAEKCLPGQD